MRVKRAKSIEHRNIFFGFLIFACVIAGANFSSAAEKKDSQGSSQGQLPEVIIKGGPTTGVSSEKPELKLEFNRDEAVLPAVELEEDLLKRQPESLQNPRAGYAESLSNKRVILPARFRLAKDPVKVFYPLREIMAVSPSLSQEIGTGWELVVTDSEGRPFRRYSGGGLPPGNISWNGRGDRGGEIISVGKTYSTVINYKDTRGQPRNYVGEPFSFDGVIHQENRGLEISMAPSALFTSKKSYEGETISDSGVELIREAADWIKRHYFTFPLRVECYAADSGVALSRAQAVAKTLASILLLPRGEITANGTSAELAKERINILIANR